MNIVAIIGGTGGQLPVIIDDLVKHGYRIRVLTRDTQTDYAKNLAATSPVSFTIGSQDDEKAIRELFTGADLALVNTNSWVLGVKAETYLDIRIFELAVQCGIKHYIWSSLDNVGYESRYTDEVRAQHYAGKAHVEQWMYTVPQTPMRWSILTTEFRLPLGDGAIPYVHLDDLAHYVRWIYENPEESAGVNVKSCVEITSLATLADAFTQVTGKPATYASPSIQDWYREVGWDQVADTKVGFRVSKDDDPSLVPFLESMANWWRLYQRSGGNRGLIRRDYDFLDRIHPGRIGSVK